MLTKEEITNKFSYHKPSEGGIESHGILTDSFLIVCDIVEDICPDGREKSLAITKLEEAKMWASAAVARNEKTR